MKIFAVIVTYNAMRRSWIEKCLKSLQASTVPVLPIVVDNGSTDETAAYVTDHHPQAVFLPQHKNLGFGQANNVGIKYSMEHDADYVMLLNQDATLAPDAIEEMLPHCSDDCLLTPLHLNGEGIRLDASFRQCLLASGDTLLDDLLLKHPLSPVYAGPDVSSACVVPAACWFIPVAVIRKIGGFNPLFFHYGEDGNYAQRLHYHHIHTMICPAATMQHDRELHGDMQAFNRHRMRVLLLVDACDINISFFTCMIRWVRTLKNMRFRLFSWISGMCWLVMRSRRIYLARSKEKKIGTTWL